MTALTLDHVKILYDSALKRDAGKRIGVCPACADTKAGRSARRATFALWDDFKGGLTFNCVRCGLKGKVSDKEAAAAIERDPAVKADAETKARQADMEEAEKRRRGIALCQAIWRGAHLPADTPVDAYLRFRGYRGALPNTIRFVPAGERCPAPMLVAAAGDAVEIPDGELAIDPAKVTGLIRIYLKPDGLGKVEVDGAAKRSLGTIKGSPVWLRPVNDGLCLAIAEGVEDALSLSGPLGIGGWAVGGAGFFEAAAMKVPRYVERVILAEDGNAPGRNGCDAAQRVLIGRRDWLSGRPPEIRRVRVWAGGEA